MATEVSEAPVPTLSGEIEEIDPLYAANLNYKLFFELS